MKRVQILALLAGGLVTTACAPVVEYQYVGTEILRNEKGHVVGHKELLVDARDGQELEQVTYYSPVLDAKGDVVGYEEAVRGGALIRGLDGRPRGARYTDLRSRGSNPGNEGITITIQP